MKMDVKTNSVLKYIVVPDPPSGPLEYSEVTDDSIRLSWNSPLEDGGGPILRYIITVKKLVDKSVIKHEIQVDPAHTYYVVTGLESGTVYLFSVAAENEAGVGGGLVNKRQIRIQEGVERPLPPGKPEVVPYTPNIFDDYPQKQTDVVTLRWDPPVSDGGSPITGYLVERKETGSPTWVRAHAIVVRDPELALSGLDSGHRYIFRVSAENALGLSEPSEVSEPVTVTQTCVATVPHFLRELKDTVALENEKVVFSVHVLGTPIPAISWYKDAYEIFSSRRARIVTENERSTLILHQAALTDEGEIKCTATNRAGHVVTRAKLQVEAPPKVQIPKEYEDGLLFEFDEIIRLKVPISGRPAPQVTWYHDNEPVDPGGRYEISVGDKSTTLRITDGRRMDRGEYTVHVQNDLGEDSGSFLVTVTDRPQQPGKVNILNVNGRSAVIEWSPPKDDGGCKIGSYIIEYYRLGWNVWLKATTSRQLTAKMTDLIEGSEYRFRVKAENPYGMSDPSDESDVIFIPDPKRGIFEPPSRAPQVAEATDEWLEERRRKRRELEMELGMVGEPQQQQEPAEMEVGPEQQHDQDQSVPEIDRLPLPIDDDLQHGDSELMLVLLPQTKKLKRDEDGDDTSYYIGEGEGVAPPISLSAPELGSGNHFEFGHLRNAVSSTEILHEKAMARFYQAAAEEEAERSRTAATRRKSSGDYAENNFNFSPLARSSPTPNIFPHAPPVPPHRMPLEFPVEELPPLPEEPLRDEEEFPPLHEEPLGDELPSLSREPLADEEPLPPLPKRFRADKELPPLPRELEYEELLSSLPVEPLTDEERPPPLPRKLADKQLPLLPREPLANKEELTPLPDEPFEDEEFPSLPDEPLEEDIEEPPEELLQEELEEFEAVPEVMTPVSPFPEEFMRGVKIMRGTPPKADEEIIDLPEEQVNDNEEYIDDMEDIESLPDEPPTVCKELGLPPLPDERSLIPAEVKSEFLKELEQLDRMEMFSRGYEELEDLSNESDEGDELSEDISEPPLKVPKLSAIKQNALVPEILPMRKIPESIQESLVVEKKDRDIPEKSILKEEISDQTEISIGTEKPQALVVSRLPQEVGSMPDVVPKEEPTSKNKIESEIENKMEVEPSQTELQQTNAEMQKSEEKNNAETKISEQPKEKLESQLPKRNKKVIKTPPKPLLIKKPPEPPPPPPPEAEPAPEEAKSPKSQRKFFKLPKLFSFTKDSKKAKEAKVNKKSKGKDKEEELKPRAPTVHFSEKEEIFEDVDPTTIIINRYSELIQEYGKSPKPPRKLYLDREELKSVVPDEDPFIEEILQQKYKEPAEEEIEETLQEEEKLELLEDEEEQFIPPPPPRPATLPPPLPYLPETIFEEEEEEEEEEFEETEAELMQSEEELIEAKKELLQAGKKVRTAVENAIDMSIIIVAFWLCFKDIRIACAFLLLLVYRKIKRRQSVED